MRAKETRYAVPGWGVGELWTSDRAVLAHEFTFDAPAGAERSGEARPDARSLEGALSPDVLVARVVDYLAGADARFDDVPLDLGDCTPFQQAVASSLRAIPRGETVSYAELSALAGYPGAARAVGTFCARNAFAFFLPCHRVVGADGIGGYGSAGVAVKRRLLALEGVTGLAA